MNPLRRLGLWLAGESVKSITTAETLPKWQRGRPYRPPSHTITNREALRGMRAAGVVYACIRLIADAATSVPLNVYRRAGEEWEHAESHPLQLLLDSPNAKLTRRRLYYRAVQHLLLSGNAILTKVRVPKSGPPVQLWPINPDLVRPIPDEAEFVSAYEVTIAGRSVRVDARDVVHLQLENPETPYWGIGPLQAAMLDIELYAGNKRWNLRTVQRGAVVPGVLEVPEDLSLEQYTALREQVDARSFTEDDAGRDLILGSGMKYHRMSLTGEEIGFLESMRFGREEIAMIFGVPPAMLTPDNATLANVEAYNKQFWETVVQPLNLGIADILTQALAPDFTRRPDELRVEHDYSQVPAMQESLDDQSQVAERLVRTGFTVAGVNRVLDLGFEEDEIKAPQPIPPALAAAQAGQDEQQPGGEDEEREERAAGRPRATKQLTRDELAALALERDQERRAWEAEVAKRVTTAFEAERDDVVQRFRDTDGSETAAITAVMQAQPAWVALLTGTYLAAARHFAEREYARLAPKARKAFDPQAIAVEWAERMAAAKVVGITDTTIEALRGIIAAGLTPGPDGFRRTTDEIARELADTYDSWMFRPGFTDLPGTIESRAYRIARTELGMAMNTGHDIGARQAAEEFELVLEKGWASARDDRVRASHALLHGEFVPIDEAFSNGLMYPGDPDGPAEEVVNCRCVLVHQVVR